ncbi:MAG: hypothetical protein ABIZ91_19840 [Gemmatimonadaceae bacterium]
MRVLPAVLPAALPAALLAALLLVAASVPAGAQLKGVRFEIKSVGDTTVAFDAGSERWLRGGIHGIAVDPRKRDVLVAQLRVLQVDGDGRVTAVVTGQTTSVTNEHVVVMQEPGRPWFRRKTFWSGLALGAALGAVAGAQR